MIEDTTRTEINRLYWGSDASVAEIADRLGISRRALYDGIDPQAAGGKCSMCASDLEFRNRTAAERREGTCSDCGHEERLAEAVDPGEDPGIERMANAAAMSPMPRPVPPTASGHALGGALLAGLAAGAALGYVLRRG